MAMLKSFDSMITKMISFNFEEAEGVGALEEATLGPSFTSQMGEEEVEVEEVVLQPLVLVWAEVAAVAANLVLFLEEVGVEVAFL